VEFQRGLTILALVVVVGKLEGGIIGKKDKNCTRPGLVEMGTETYRYIHPKGIIFSSCWSSKLRERINLAKDLVWKALT